MTPRQVKWLAAALMTIGVVLRVARWLHNRSLWLDEVFLADNLIKRSFIELLGPLDFRQGAAPLFLWLCKLAITIFGQSELALRLVPLIAGILSILLFWIFARHLLAPRAALLALGLFVFVEPLIYYSSEIKQYSTDVAACLGVPLAFIRWQQAPAIKRLVLFTAAGAIGMLLSHPCVFIVATACLLMLFMGLRRERIAAIAVLAAAFVTDYLLFLRPLGAIQSLHQHWEAGYPPLSTRLPLWLFQSWLNLFRGYATMWLRFESVRDWPAYLAAVLAAGGLIELGRRAKPTFWLIIGPILLTFAAAALRKYPFDDRLVLFLVPLLLIAIAAVVEALVVYLPDKQRFIPFILYGFILVPTAGRAMSFLIHPPGREEIKPVLAYLAQHIRDGDRIYLYHASDAPYVFYRDRYGLTQHPFVVGQRPLENPQAFEQDVAQLTQQRSTVWVLVTHPWQGERGSEEEMLLSLLRRHGTERGAMAARGAAVYRFDFGATAQ